MLHPQATDVAAQEESAQYAQRNGVDARSQDEKMAAAQNWAKGAELAQQSTNPDPTAMAVAAVPPSALAATEQPEQVQSSPPSRGDWSQTKLTPEEEAQFQKDMVTKPGYKDWYEAAKKDWGHAPDFDDPENDYDYRGAWKGGVVPAVYKHDGKYHWSSSLDNGQMLKAPDHPTAWMEYFMRATGKDPNDVGVKNEHEAVEYMGKNPQVRAAAETAIPPEAITPFRPAAKKLPGALKDYIEEAEERGVAEKRAALIQAQGEKAEADLTQKQANDIDERLKRHNAAIDEQMTDIRRTKAAMEDANLRSDQSSHIEHKETTRSKIAGLLALAGGMFGDALAIRGGDMNPQHLARAQAGLDKIVEQDLAQQRERYNNDKEAAKRAGDQYAMAVNIFGQTPEADKFTNLLNSQKYTAELAAQAAMSKNDNVRAAGVVLKEKNDQDSKLEEAKLLAGVDRARMSGARGSAKDNKTYVADELLARQNAGLPLTAAEDAIATRRAAQLLTRGNAENKQETAEEKAATAAADERREIAAGWKRLPNQRKLEQADIRQIDDIQKNSIALVYAAKEAQRLWNIVMDPNTPEEERAKARVSYNARRNDYLSSLSVGTGQGTITKSDAERTGNDAPTLPLDKAGWAKASENWAKGEDPSRAYDDAATFYQSQADAKLRGMGNAPSEEADAKWAEWDAKQPKAPEKAPPRYEAGTKPPEKPAPKGEGKPATDMVEFMLNGNKGSVPAAQADAFQKKYPDAKRL
jgi:hypothetical protein